MIRGAIALESCRVCRGPHLRFDRELASCAEPRRKVTFLECDGCGSILSTEDSTHDYGFEEDVAGLEAAVQLRKYLEAEASVRNMARLVLLACAARGRSGGRQSLRLLDVGAGVGLCVDLARHLGWDAVGVEPSANAAAGRELLGVELIGAYVESAVLPHDAYDVILLSEVIEHVANADELLRRLAGLLAPEGVLVLTTPNSRAIARQGLGEREWLECYYPGFHHTLFSPESLRLVLGRSDFADARILVREGSSGQKRLVALAAKERNALPQALEQAVTEEDVDALVTEYLASTLARRVEAGRKDAWYWGAAYRLFEQHVNRGQYAEAATLASAIDGLFAEKALGDAALQAVEADTLPAYLEQVPAFAGAYCYYRGLLAINHERDWEKGLGAFRACRHLSTIEERLSANYLGNLATRATLHEGIVLARVGRTAEALACFDALLVQPSLPSELPRQIQWEKGITHLEAGQNGAAFRVFMESLLEDTAAITPHQQKLVRHAFEAILQEIQSLRRECGSLAKVVTSNVGRAEAQVNRLLAMAGDASEKLQMAKLHGKRVLTQLQTVLATVQAVAEAVGPLVRLGVRTVRAAGWCMRLPRRTWRWAGSAVERSRAAVRRPRHSAPAERDLLIITPDRVGKMRIGLAMRHWEIAAALARRGLKVTLASTQPVLDRLEAPGFDLEDLSQDRARALPLAERHAAVLLQGNVLDAYTALGKTSRPILADMVTPVHIESIQTSQETYLRSLAGIQGCLKRADFFVCGNESQRLYWLGMLTALGRISKDERDRHHEFRDLIDLVGFGIPDEPPRKTRPVLKGVRRGIEPGDLLVLWFGGIWDWLDPLPLVRGVHEAHQECARIKLFFSMFRKNGEPAHAMAVRARDLARELGALDRSIFFNELPIPFDDRADYLMESDFGVVMQAANFETQLSARTRALDYLWAELPLLMNRGDEISDLVERRELGAVVQRNEADELRRVLLAHARDPSWREPTRERIRRIRPEFLWSKQVEPIARYLEKARQTR